MTSTPTPEAPQSAGLSLRQTLFLGAGLGILLPALALGYFQITSRYENEVNLRVRAPMQQYADVLSRGVAVAIWNVDHGVANELVDAVMRNPDVVRVTVTDEYKEIFVRKQSEQEPEGEVLREERDINYNGARVGRLSVELTAQRIQREFLNDLIKLAAALAAQVGISFLFIWWLFDRRMMRPLHSLQEGVQRLARGELAQPLVWQREDEIGGLARGMDTMRTDLAALIAERDEKNAALQTELAERRRTEEALGFSQAKFAAIFDASPIAMTVSHMTGEFPILDVNSAWVRVFGRDRSVAIGSNGETNGMWKNRDARDAVMQTLLQQGEISRYLAWMVRGDGQGEMLCEISGRVIALGQESLLILAYDDITAKHQYEADILRLNATLEQRVDERTRELTGALDRLTAAQSELVRAEKMSALGSLVAGIAHELNTPIGNSLTVASTLQDHANSFTNEMAKGLTRSRLEEFVGNIRQGSGILMRGLHQAAELVSSFKQVAVDQTSVNRRRFQLAETINEILLTLGPTMRKTSHTVSSQVASDITMESFPGPLGQVITNLINNALLHAFEGRQQGHITISAVAVDADWIKFTVQDDGVGIPPAHLARVFDPFFTTKLGQGGSGLGLNIVYNLVTKTLGGNIRVDSAPGQGACFTLTLPVVAPVVAPEH
ncbi:sensor histidine kinase [Rhodoferax saidenbachensis]|uniref:histidine kinase n=1 Tax=Rhodoferax saidenbachensis TaxID=1484693 RepID=A0A1P8K6B4_9BURK|nr:ATP-binding protein [Rhodoferax saidenbachensis]APW41545.1 ATP-binding protein [Rhodoferax saidenbachensis]